MYFVAYTSCFLINYAVLIQLTLEDLRITSRLPANTIGLSSTQLSGGNSKSIVYRASTYVSAGRLEYIHFDKEAC
jgi:hypothetical protein